MLCDPRLAGQGSGHHFHAKMAFSAFLKPCVTAMHFAFVHNIQMFGIKCIL
jgi:hypothetical protein